MPDFSSVSVSTMPLITHDAVLLVDGRNRLQTANPRYLEWTGFDADQVVGRDVADVWEDPRRWADWQTGFRLQGGTVPQETLDLKTKSGDPIPVDARMTVLPTRWGKPSGILLALQDLRTVHLLEKTVQEDPLTGVASRVQVLARLEAELARSRRFGTALGLVYMDVDGFRTLNELWGPEFGDQVLRVAGAELREILRPGDAAGRTGSDEFLVLMPQASPFQAEEAAHRLRTALSRRLFAPQGFEVAVTASFGVSAVRGQDPAPVSVLLARVGEALDRARARGRNRVEFSP
jgi:diguanylate cyclase (GGDEF)-like protein/PAS domain S-box-containing protein